MKTVKVVGLVLRTRKYGEADHLLSLLTPELGKVAAIAKGARKAKGSMRGKTQPFVYGSFLLYQGKNLSTVTQAEIITSHNSLGEDVTKYSYASYLCELTDALLMPGEPLPEVFVTLLGALKLISLEPEPLVLPWFQLQLLTSTGYEPQLEHCVACGENVPEGPTSFSPFQGGVICSRCTAEEPNISGGARAAMIFLACTSLMRLGRLKLTPAIQQEVAEHMDSLIKMQVERPLKSEQFLRSISSAGIKKD